VNKVLYYDYHEFCRNDGCSGTAQNIIICCCCSICKLLKVHWFWSLLLLDGYTVTQMDDMSIVQSSEPLFHDTWSILYEKVNPAPLQIFFLIYCVKAWWSCHACFPTCVISSGFKTGNHRFKIQDNDGVLGIIIIN